MTLPDTVFNIYGHLSPDEAALLYKLASEVPAGGIIVEIGSFQGRSTVCLGLGAKQAGAWVYAIDPHTDVQIDEQTHYGMENHAALLKNLVEFEVADVVRVVALDANSVWDIWGNNPIDLLWIDGLHDYRSVQSDLTWWTHTSSHSKIALHDSTGHFPDVIRAVNGFLDEHHAKWQFSQIVDAITVWERIP